MVAEVKVLGVRGSQGLILSRAPALVSRCITVGGWYRRADRFPSTMPEMKLPFVGALLLLSSAALGQLSDASPQIGCSDPSAIEWFLPHEFDAALARARAERRLLVIKGISFGVNEAGAKSATMGTW